MVIVHTKLGLSSQSISVWCAGEEEGTSDGDQPCPCWCRQQDGQHCKLETLQKNRRKHKGKQYSPDKNPLAKEAPEFLRTEETYLHIPWTVNRCKGVI
ncbi:hypothetical protein V1264_011352 [Littorina saxatilis]|uniref:Uncharacterized protein n=1 Tax=Littorina saxatilis TaxID=31220 RepID=A0AAN9BSN5_9CAEN